MDGEVMFLVGFLCGANLLAALWSLVDGQLAVATVLLGVSVSTGIIGLGKQTGNAESRRRHAAIGAALWVAMLTPALALLSVIYT